jgi:hypothetical protein
MRATRSLHSPSLLSVSLALLAGCADSDPGTAISGPQPPKLEAVAAASRGAEVIKDWIIITVTGGAPGNLALAVGFDDLASLCATGNAVISPQRGQAVFTPSGKGQLHTFTHEAFVQVFSFSAPITDFCDPAGAPVVASGTVTFSQVVHEVSEGVGAFTLHATIQGTVDLAGGGQARLFATAQAVIRPNGTVVQDRTTIRLTPL